MPGSFAQKPVAHNTVYRCLQS